MRVGNLKNRVFDEGEINQLRDFRDRAAGAKTLGDVLKLRRALDQRINFGGAQNTPLFARDSDANFLMQEMRTRFNDAIENTLRNYGDQGDVLADFLRANNEAYSKVLQVLGGVDEDIKFKSNHTEDYVKKIRSLGIDDIKAVKELAAKDKQVGPVYDEIRRTFYDSLLLDAADPNAATGISHAKFKNAWQKVPPEMKELVFSGDDLSRIERAISDYAPQKIKPSNFGERILGGGSDPRVAPLTKRLENIGSDNNREFARDLAFLDDVLGNKGDERFSKQAQDLFLGKQLGMDPTAAVGTDPMHRTGLANRGAGIGAATGGSLAAAVDPMLTPLGVIVGGAIGKNVQSPAAALIVYRMMNRLTQPGTKKSISNLGLLGGDILSKGVRSNVFMPRGNQPR